MSTVRSCPAAMLLLGCTLLAGCATKLAAHAPTPQGIRQLRDSGISPVRVGTFVLADGVPADRDRYVTIRTSGFEPTDGKSFSQFLKDSLIVDLKAAGKFDAGAPTELRGELLKNELHSSGPSEGHGLLAVRFYVFRAEKMLLDKEMQEQDSWPSSFFAIPSRVNGVNGYTGLYTKLLLQLYADKDFIEACTVREATTAPASSSPPPPPSPTPLPR